jgi:hypothetical protein
LFGAYVLKNDVRHECIVKRSITVKLNQLLVATTTAILAAAGLGSSAAMAAQTRALPEGEIFYAIDCNDSIGQMVTVDVLTSAATLIGANTPTSNTTCAGPAAWDPSTGTMYWTSWTNNPDTLMVADIETGQSTEVGPFMVGSSPIGSDGIAIDAQGNAYLLDDDGDGSTPVGTKLYSLDLATGAATYIANVEGMTGSFACVAAFAFNPADGGFYANCDTGSGTETLVKIDVSDGSTTVACTWTHSIWGLAFDSSGIGWVPDNGDANLTSFDVSLGGSCGEEVGTPIQVNGVNWYTGSNVIATSSTPPGPEPTPVLPATGMSEHQMAVSAFAAVVAMSLAVALFALKRVARRKV